VQVVYVTAETHGWQEYDGAIESNPDGITRFMRARTAPAPLRWTLLYNAPRSTGRAALARHRAQQRGIVRGCNPMIA
jgi:hypothetical protein